MGTAIDIYSRKHVSKSFDLTNNNDVYTVYEIVEKITEHIFVDDSSIITNVNLGILNKSHLEKYIDKIIKAKGFKINNLSTDELIDEVKKHLLGYGPLDSYIRNEECSNIYINSPNDVWVQIGKDRYKTSIKFGSVSNLQSYINTIQMSLGAVLNNNEALTKFYDEENRLRIISAIKPISHLTPTLMIRKHRKDSFSLEQLLEMKMINEEIFDFLFSISQDANISIMFTGSGGAGKTTLMRAMIERVDENNQFSKRILVMEESPELFIERDNTQQFLTKTDKGVEFSIGTFTDYGNLMSIDMYVFGEIRGKEALPFFDGAFSGNVTWNTTHSDSVDNAIYKMALNMKKSGTDIDLATLKNQLYHSVNLIIHLDKFCVLDIAEVDQLNQSINKLYTFNIKKEYDTFYEGNWEKVNEPKFIKIRR